MKLNKRWTTVLIGTGLLIAALVAGIALTGWPTSAAAAGSAQTADACADDDLADDTEVKAADSADPDDVECPGGGDNDAADVQEGNDIEDNDAEEPKAAAPADTNITADHARAIVEAAYPGTTVKEVEFEEGYFEAKLSNGTEVRVDATTGSLLSVLTDDGG